MQSSCGRRATRRAILSEISILRSRNSKMAQVAAYKWIGAWPSTAWKMNGLWETAHILSTHPLPRLPINKDIPRHNASIS